MTEINWVAARGSCSVNRVLKDLSDVIERDVAEINTLASELHLWTFEAVEEGDKLIVKPNRDAGSFQNQQFVAFEKREDGIRVFGLLATGVRRREQLPEFTITPRWDDATLTRELLVNGEPHELWQISKRALEGLFVPSWREPETNL